MYIPYQFMMAMEDDRLRTAARDGQAAAVRRERRRLRGARRDQRPGRRPVQILPARTAG
ncbi:MAG: hypothetical protein ABR926_10475 [Streptosporangiaceae bacterium]